MLFGICPFIAKDISSLINLLESTNVKIPDNIPVSKSTVELLLLMLVKNPDKRIGWDYLFEKFDVSKNLNNDNLVSNDKNFISATVINNNYNNNDSLKNIFEEKSKIIPSKSIDNFERKSGVKNKEMNFNKEFDSYYNNNDFDSNYNQNDNTFKNAVVKNEEKKSSSFTKEKDFKMENLEEVILELEKKKNSEDLKVRDGIFVLEEIEKEENVNKNEKGKYLTIEEILKEKNNYKLENRENKFLATKEKFNEEIISTPIKNNQFNKELYIEKYIQKTNLLINKKQNFNDFYSIKSTQNLKKMKKNEMMNFLINERKKVIYINKILKDLLIFDNNPIFKEEIKGKDEIYSSFKIFTIYFNKYLNCFANMKIEKLNEFIKKREKSHENNENYINSYDFNKFISIFNKEINIIFDNFIYYRQHFLQIYSKKSTHILIEEIESLSNFDINIDLLFKIAIEFLENLIEIANENDKKNILIFCNKILDALLINELFENFIGEEISLEKENYFNYIENSTLQTLEFVIKKKMNFCKEKKNNFKFGNYFSFAK